MTMVFTLLFCIISSNHAYLAALSCAGEYSSVLNFFSLVTLIPDLNGSLPFSMEITPTSSGLKFFSE